MELYCQSYRPPRLRNFWRLMSICLIAAGTPQARIESL